MELSSDELPCVWLSEQSGPPQKGWHTHCGGSVSPLHLPYREQPDRHTGVPQSGPVQCLSQRHWAGSTLESQVPRPLQFSSAPGHRTTEQSAPRHLSAHWHVPLTQVPCSLSVQSAGEPGHDSSKMEQESP